MLRWERDSDVSYHPESLCFVPAALTSNPPDPSSQFVQPSLRIELHGA